MFCCFDPQLLLFIVVPVEILNQCLVNHSVEASGLSGVNHNMKCRNLFTFAGTMSTKSKNPKESFTIMNELVLPNDTNTLNNLMGGRLLHWMDIAAAISAQKHCNRIVVTASVDNVSFKQPIKLGDVITIEAKVTRAFHTSVEVRLDVWAENIPSGTRAKSNEAYYTFVAVDQSGRTIPVPELVPENDDEAELFAGALRRRQLRLILAGKMLPNDAKELKALFFKE
jgi:acyl-CoA hydrolase